MGKILGLDLGQNSIGWAIIDGNKATDRGVHFFDNRLTEVAERNNSVFDLKSKLRENYRLICLTFLVITFFGMVIFMPDFWQFWINLAIAGLYTTLAYQGKK